MPWRRPNLALKLASAFFALSLAAVGLAGYVVYTRSSSVLRDQISARITATADLKTVEVENWIRDALDDARSFAGLALVTSNMEKWRQSRESPASTIWSTAFGPKGRLLATGGANHLAQVWDIETGARLQRLQHQNTVRLVLFPAGDSHLLTIDYENIMRLWNLQTGNPTFSQRLVHILSLSAPGDGRLLAASTWNKKVFVWPVATLLRPGAEDSAPVLTLEGDRGTDSWVAISRDGRLLAVADGKEYTALYRLEAVRTGLDARLLALLPGGDAGLAFDPEGRWLAALSKDGSAGIHLLHPRSGAPVPGAATRVHIQAGEERELAFSPDGFWLGVRNDASASFDLLGLEHMSATGQPGSWRTRLSLDEVYGFGFSPQPPNLMITARDDFDAVAWDLSRMDDQQKPLRHDFVTEAEGGAGVAFSPQADRLTVASWTGRVQLFETADVLASSTPRNLAPQSMGHAPLPLVLLADALRAQVDSRPQWQAAALYDDKGQLVAEAPEQHGTVGASLPAWHLQNGADLRSDAAQDSERPGLLLAAAVIDGNGQQLGTLACRLGHAELDRILREHTGVGEHGELYLVAQSKLLGDSRGRIRAGPELAETLPGHDLGGPYKNHAGAQVFGVSRTISPVEWQLVAEMPVNEALAPARTLAWTALLSSGLVVLLLLGAGYLLSRRIALPIMAAASMAQKIVTGHVDPEAKALEGDEAKILAAAFTRVRPALEERVRILQALDIANEVQGSLLPSASPDVPGLDIAGRCDFCEATGGDYFDYLLTRWPQGEGLAMIVADVTGHGVPAALLMTSLRAFLRQGLAASAAGPEPGEPAAVIAEVNRQLARDLGLSGRFATLFYLDIHRPSLSIRWVRAGHDPALVYDPETDRFHHLEGSGLALGVIEDAAYEQRMARVAPGQIIVLGTDGIWEACGEERKMFGKERLEAIVRSMADRPAAEILQAVFEAVHEHRRLAPKGREHPDDVTLMVARIISIPADGSGNGI